MRVEYLQGLNGTEKCWVPIPGFYVSAAIWTKEEARESAATGKHPERISKIIRDDYERKYGKTDENKIGMVPVDHEQREENLRGNGQ